MQYSVVLQQPLETITFPCHLFYCLLYRELTLNPRKWVTNAKTVLSQSTSECSIFSLRGIHSPLTALPPHYFFFWNAYSQCQRLMSRQPRQAVAGYCSLENKEHSFLYMFWNLQVSKSMAIFKTCNICSRCYRRRERVSMNRATSWFLYLTKWSYYSVLEIIH